MGGAIRQGFKGNSLSLKLTHINFHIKGHINFCYNPFTNIFCNDIHINLVRLLKHTQGLVFRMGGATKQGFKGGYTIISIFIPVIFSWLYVCLEIDINIEMILYQFLHQKILLLRQELICIHINLAKFPFKSHKYKTISIIISNFHHHYCIKPSTP